MADKITFKVGSINNLPTKKTPGQLLFAHEGTTGSIFLDINDTTRVKLNSDAKKLEASDITINDTLFDGSQSIITSVWGHARPFTIGDTMLYIDGGEINGYKWTHEDIGASVSNSWTNGTSEGPVLTITVNGDSGEGIAIPTASTERSGVVTNNSQTFGGIKYFADGIVAENDDRNPFYSFKSRKTNKILSEIYSHGYNTSISENLDDVSFRFRNYSYTTNSNTVLNTYEEFYLPSVDPDRSGSESYEIFTSKNLVTLDDRFVNITGDTMTGVLQLENNIVAFKGFTAKQTPQDTSKIINALLIDTDKTIGKADFNFNNGDNTWRFYQASVNNSGAALDFGRYYVLPSAPKNLTANESVNIISSAGGIIDGTLILAKTEYADPNQNSEPALIVGGLSAQPHLELDSNELMAKSSATSPSTLYLNRGGGNIIVGGHIMATHPSGGELSLRVVYGENKYFYLYGNNSSGARGMYDTTRGAVIKVEDTTTTFYGYLNGNADTATKLTATYGSESLPVYFNSGAATPIKHLWLGSSSSNDLAQLGVRRKSSSANIHSNMYMAINSTGERGILEWNVTNNGTTQSRNINFTTASVYPIASNTLDFGTTSSKWNNIYGTTLHGNLSWDYLTGKPATYTPSLYIHSAGGTGGVDGYIKFATVKVIRTYANAPIVIELSKRRKTLSSVLYLTFTNADSLDPAFGSFKFTGEDYECYVHKSSASTWDLYCRKAEGYDNISVIRRHIPNYMTDAVTLTWTDVQVANYPEGSYPASPGGLTDKLGTGRNLTIGNAIEVFDGSQNVEWTANEIGLMSLSQIGTAITNGADLNTYTTPGNYYTLDGTTTASLHNAPLIDTAMRLVVMTHFGSNNTNYIKQFAFGPTETIYIRVKSYNADGQSGAWGDWRGLGLVEEAGILPVTGGGTGANNAEDALINLGGVGYTIVTDLSTLL